MIFRSIDRKNHCYLFLLTLIVLVAKISCEISLLKYYEAEHALAHVIKSIKLNKLE
jgi:hypothetical protein